MRHTAAALLFLVCSNVQVLAQAAATESSAEPAKVNPTKAPAPQNVNVLNFPGVQTVGGAVDVGNLPLDADGAMRVTCGSATSRQTQYVSLINEPLTIPPNTTGYVTAVVETAGFSRIGFLIEADSEFFPRIEWGWGGTPERFGMVDDPRNGVNTPGSITVKCQYTGRGRNICYVSGDRVRLAFDNTFDQPVQIAAVGIYLIP